jgi:hypothetical protein
MTQSEWIVCERNGRWTAALRTAIARQDTPLTGNQPVHEVRSLPELSARVAERPGALALVEVHRINIAETLSWLAEAGLTYPGARFVALVDRHQSDGTAQSDMAGALLAAGAVGVADSPRRLQHVLSVGRRHFASQGRMPDGVSENQSLAEWAWGLLPWQPA